MAYPLPALRRAELDGDRHYFGKVCDKHPELNGERYTSDRFCLGCRRDASRRSYYRHRTGRR